MGDIAALTMDLDGPISPMNPAPAAHHQEHYSAAAYAYQATSHESKQATHYRYLGLSPGPINQAPKKEGPENLAFYMLQEAYEQNSLCSRKQSEQFADDYERYCLQDGQSSSHQVKKTKETPAAAASPQQKRNVCNSCLRPFDDGYYKPATLVREASSPKPQAGKGVSFDAELGAWMLHYYGNTQQEALHNTNSGKPLLKKMEQQQQKPWSDEAQKSLDDFTDAAYVDHHTHLHAYCYNNRTVMPVRTKKEPSSPRAVALACEMAATGDIMSDYDEFLRGNHVVVGPAETRKQTQVADRDIMVDYDNFLRSNQVAAVAAAPSETKKPVAEIKSNTTVATAGRGVMADYEAFLDCVPATSVREQATPPKAPAVVEDEEIEEDLEMDFVDVRNEEYLDFLATNHTVAGAMVRTETKVVKSGAHVEGINSSETVAETKPVVCAEAAAYERFYTLGGNSVAGPPWTIS